MVRIVATPEQVKVLTSVHDSVEIVDAQGRRLGLISPEIDAAEIALARERACSNQPRLTTQQVLEHLRSLDRP